MATVYRLLVVFCTVLAVSNAFVLPQNPSSVVVECGKESNATELYPGRSPDGIIVRTFSPESEQYRHDEDCQVTFVTEDQPLILKLAFRSFDVESHPECVKDFLCVNGVRFCGEWAVDKEYSFFVPANNSFTLHFSSDSELAGKGFEVSIDADVAGDGERQLEISSGVGSAENLLITDTSTPEDYLDRCRVDSEGRLEARDIINRIRVDIVVETFDDSENPAGEDHSDVDNPTTSSWNTPINRQTESFTNNWYNPTTRDYDSTTNNWYNPTTRKYDSSTNNWYNPTTRDYDSSTNNWYNPTTRDYDSSTNNWYNPTTRNYPWATNNWYNPTTRNYDSTTNNWYNPTTRNYDSTTNNWYNPTTINYPWATNNWYNPTTRDPWATNNWYNPTTRDYPWATNNWYNPTTRNYDSLTNNWYNPTTRDYPWATNNWYNPTTRNYESTTNNWNNPWATNNWYNPTTRNYG